MSDQEAWGWAVLYFLFLWSLTFLPWRRLRLCRVGIHQHEGTLNIRVSTGQSWISQECRHCRKEKKA